MSVQFNNKTNNFENGLNWQCKLTLFLAKEYSYRINITDRLDNEKKICLQLVVARSDNDVSICLFLTKAAVKTKPLLIKSEIASLSLAMTGYLLINTNLIFSTFYFFWFNQRKRCINLYSFHSDITHVIKNFN